MGNGKSNSGKLNFAPVERAVSAEDEFFAAASGLENAGE